MKEFESWILVQSFIQIFLLPKTKTPRGSAKFTTFLLLHIKIQCVPGESDFEAFTILKILSGMCGGKLSAANTPLNLNVRCLQF